jgi:hypothetical protein
MMVENIEVIEWVYPGRSKKTGLMQVNLDEMPDLEIHCNAFALMLI